MPDLQSYENRQRAYEDRYYARMDRDRPTPVKEYSALVSLAEAALTDPAKAIEWATVATPENFLAAHRAQRWDDANPFYSCVICHDGKDLVPGYVCQACGGEGS